MTKDSSYPIAGELIERIDRVIGSNIGYMTKSEFIRDALRRLLDEKEKQIKEREVEK